MKFQFISAFLLAQVVTSAAFTPGTGNTRTSTSRSSSSALNAIPTPEESAKALTAYMVRSHEEKIKALKTLEEKKNAEIASLRAQMGDRNTSIVPAAGAAAATAGAPSGDVQILSEKLVKYQIFMAEYIIKAQEEKAKAVKEAEVAVAKKYEDKLNAFMLNPAAAGTGTGTSVAAEADEPRLYKERNAKISAAAKAGTSRWGDREVERAGAKAPPSQLLKPIPPINVATGGAVPEEVIAADHGLRADGGVGGLSLAERVMNGAAEADEPRLYKERNAKIAAAAKAGTSRWGDREVERAGAKAPPSMLLKPIPPINAATVGGAVPEEVIAADHGLRADGGVGGLSLAERVMNGAAAPAATATSSNPNFEKRNAKIAAAAKSGKQSRWGSREVDKAIEYSATALPASRAVNIAVLAEVEAADHGLRADGGVGGPSLAERVNLGARLLQQ